MLQKVVTNGDCIPHTWGHNKVRELATVRLPWQQFVRTGQTVNQVYYLEVLKRLHEKLRRKRLELFANNSWIDNAHSHTALSLGEFLATTNNCVEKPCLFTGSSPQLLFSVPGDKGNIERKAF